MQKVFEHFKQTRTYNECNPAERVSTPGVNAERSAEYSALTPRHTAMHAYMHLHSTLATNYVVIHIIHQSTIRTQENKQPHPFTILKEAHPIYIHEHTLKRSQKTNN